MREMYENFTGEFGRAAAKARTLLLCTVCISALGATSATAQSMPASNEQAQQSVGVEDIVVTAQRRSQRLQDVPVAVSAVTAAKLESAGIQSTQELSLVAPGLQIKQNVGFIQPYIRGVGSSTNGPGLEPPVATYIDGVYIASASSALMTLSNIERIEVLKGPQGTLFGRNATGGLIQVVTRDPTNTPKLDIGLTYGNYRTVIAEGYVAGGLAPNLAADVAIRYEHQGDGWGTNLFNGSPVGDLPHDFVVRSKIVFTPNSGTKITLAGDYTDRSSRREQQRLGRQYPGTFNIPAFGGPYNYGSTYDVNSNVTQPITNEAGGGSLKVEQDLGDKVKLQSITAYRQSSGSVAVDIDLTPQPIAVFSTTSKQKQFTQELQLSSAGSSRLKWVAGLFYFHANDRKDPQNIIFGATPASPIPGVPVRANLTDQQISDSIAGYAQASYEVLPDTNITLGGRYTHEIKKLSGVQNTFVNGVLARTGPIPAPGLFPDELKFNKFNYRISLDHKFAPGIMGYVSYNTGFKSGGFNLANANNPPYLPETIGAYEVGLKNELFDRRVRLNASAYRYSYRNVQVGRYINNSISIQNGAAARIYGFEIDGEVVVSGDLTLSGGYAYTHARFTSFPNADYIVPVGSCVPLPGGLCTGSAAGKRMPFTPTSTFNIGGNYKHETSVGTFGLNATYFHTSKVFSNPDNVGFQAPYDLLNASVSWTDLSGHLSFRVWGKNLTKSVYATNLVEAGQGLVNSLGAPRTYGVTLGYKY